MNRDVSINAVHDFWENNPLFLGEASFNFGTAAFFNEHTKTVISDCFAGSIDVRTMPTCDSNAAILDAGCGIGFWTEIFARNGFTNVYACDLTQKAVNATLERVKRLEKNIKASRQNLELLQYPDDFFHHINCQGVIHHTPNPQNAINEIYRALTPGGTASVSVYYNSPVLKVFSLAPFLGAILKKIGVGLEGRGREDILKNNDIKEIVRMYDGKDNPIGKSYSKKEFKKLLSKFDVDEFYLHYFPLRRLKLQIPRKIHSLLDRHLGLMLYANISKPDNREG
jgi:SAM-dependent methyltransferase